MIGAGRSQRSAVERARELGYRVAAADGDPDAPALEFADIAIPLDFSQVDELAAAARKHRVEGVLTVASDRAVPVVAEVAERLGLPGIGSEVAQRMTNKLLMRQALAAAGVPQPLFAGAYAGQSVAGARGVGRPAVVKPADSGGQRGISLVSKPTQLAPAVDAALAISSTGSAIVERYHEGRELNCMLVVRDGEPTVVTLSDRLRPPGAGFGVGWIHQFPSTLSSETLQHAEDVAGAAVLALGLRDGIAFPQLLATPDGEVLVIEVAARIAAGQMSDLVRHGTGVDLVEIALLQSVGRPVPDELVQPRTVQPLAIRFLTAEPGVLSPGRVTAIENLDAVRAARGVVAAELYFGIGGVIRPVQVDDDRRGYVIATGETSDEALVNAQRAAELLVVKTDQSPAWWETPAV